MSTNSTNPIVNPFILAQDQLRFSLTVQDLPGWFTERLILSVIFGVLLVCVIVTMIFRFRNSTLWFFRMKQTTHGQFISPNSIASFLASSFFFLWGIQFYLWMPSIFLDLSVWLCLFIGRWIMSWGLTVATLTSVTRKPNDSFDLCQYPRTINFCFLLVPFLSLAIILPLSCLAQIREGSVASSYTMLDSNLSAAIIDFNAGKNVNLIPIEILSGQLQNHMGMVATYNHWTWISWTALTLLDLIVFVVASIVHVQFLLSSVKNIRQQQNASSTRKMETLNSAVSSLIATSYVTMLIGLSHLAASVFFVLLPADRVLSAGSELAALIVLWVYAVCGGASYILILIRTFSSSISHNNHSITSRLPATIFSSRKATKVSDEVVTVNITQIVHRDVQIAVQGDEFYSVELQAMKGSQAVYKADYNNWN